MRRNPVLVLGVASLALGLGVTACSASASSGSPGAAARGPATGTVTVKAGNKVVCVMTLAAGKGTCAVNTARYAPGTLTFVASYSGSGRSSRATASVRLNRATSKTSLAMSAASVTYGHEQAERLSVRVAPQFSGTPGGRVTVAAGHTVVCVITLAAGAGSCALTAKKLTPGSYRLAASYGGSTSFAASASAARTLVVAA
jgi:hypothetical protein